LLRQRAINVNAAEGDGTTALHWAVHWDDLETADLLLRAGAKVNVKTDYGVTPLMLACGNGNAAIVAKLLEAGADVNAALSTGETVLMLAARTGSAAAVKALLSHRVDVQAKERIRGQTALMWAAAQNHPDVIRLLAERGADVEARSTRGFTPLLFAARAGALEAVGALRDAGADLNESLPSKASVLLVAVINGRADVGKWLVEQGADPNAADDIGMTPLHAAFFRQTAVPGLVNALLAHGANPNTRLLNGPAPLPSEIGSYAFLAGATPFVMAARAGDAAMMRVLAAAGADPKLPTTNGTTALMVASGLGRFNVEGNRTEDETTRALAAAGVALALGVDINAASNAGQTALHGAAGSSGDPLVRFLAANGAALQVKDRTGRTPLDLAERALRDGGSQTTVDLLRKLGG
jgi:ankyrin repeat protein